MANLRTIGFKIADIALQPLTGPLLDQGSVEVGVAPMIYLFLSLKI
jgi:hypothetical protein